MWNFTFTIPSILVLFILLVYYLIRPRLPIRMNRSFLQVLSLELVVILFDLLSSIADENYASVPVPVLVLLNLLFFIFFLARIFAFFLITTDLLHMRSGASFASLKGILVYSLVFIVSEIIAVSTIWTGAIFRITEKGYERGPLYNIIYFCFFFYIALSIILLIVKRKQIRLPDFVSALAFNLLLLIGNIVRILLPNYLVMNTFCLLAILIIFLAFENPDFYITYQYAFNLRGLREVMNEWIRKDSYRILGFSLREFIDAQAIYGVKQMDIGILMIIEFLREKHPELMLFYLRMGQFAIVGSGEMDWEALQAEIAERFQEPWKEEDAELFLRPVFVRLSSESGIATSDQIITSLLVALTETGKTQGASDVFTDIDHAGELEKRIAVKRSLQKAIEKNGVELFLQPIVKCGSRKPIAAEALARIRNDKGELIPPALFIPLAEQNGQINSLGEQMIEKACAFLEHQEMNKMDLQWINVNLSPIQCMNQDLSNSFASILNGHGISPEYIHLEITEATVVDFSILSEQMAALIQCGFRFSLDDYGSGYSNLSRIKRYPFSNVKLDMAVVQKHCEEPDIILPTLIKVFKEQGFSITAEGIETEEMADIMENIGCDYLQGYYFSKPLPAEDFIEIYE